MRMLPTLPGVALAPTTATERGWKIGSSECRTADMAALRGPSVVEQASSLARRHKRGRLCYGRSLPRQRVEALAQLAGDRTGLAVADRPAVRLDHRHDLSGGAGQEALVGGVDVVPSLRDLL